MEKFLVFLNLTGLPLLELALRALGIAKSMDDNASSLPNITPTSAELRSKAQTLNELLERQTVLKNELGGIEQQLKMERVLLQNMLKNVGNYVEGAANQKQDPSLIEKMGFGIRQQGSSTTGLGVPLHLRLLEIPNTSGALQIVFDPVTSARSYGLIWYYGDVPPTAWPETPMRIIASSRGNKLKFERGKTVWVRVKAYGPNNTESDWSDVAMRIVP